METQMEKRRVANRKYAHDRRLRIKAEAAALEERVVALSEENAELRDEVARLRAVPPRIIIRPPLPPRDPENEFESFFA